jgi:hypothetical protein
MTLYPQSMQTGNRTVTRAEHALDDATDDAGGITVNIRLGWRAMVALSVISLQVIYAAFGPAKGTLTSLARYVGVS